MRCGRLFLSLCLPLLVAFIFSPINLAARDIYVDNVNGDDRNDGSQATQSGRGIGPCRSITRALKHASGSDRVILINSGEPYRESIVLNGARHSGSEHTPFVLYGNGAVLDGTQPVSPEAWEHVEGNLFRFQPNYLSHQQLYMDEIPAARVHVESQPAADDLEDLQWALYRGYIYFKVEESRLPQSYGLTHSYERVGLSIYAARHIRVLDLTIQGFAIDGINAHDTVFSTTISGVTSRGNGRSGISIGGACRVEVESCLIGNNGLAQVRGEGSSIAELFDCDVIDDDPNAPDFTKRDRATILVEGSEIGD